MPVVDESVLDLVLGFFGDREVATANASALLNDLISAHRRTQRSGAIRFVIPVEPLTNTLEELAELCLNGGYKLELIGHARALEDPKVVRYTEDADMIIEVPDQMRLAAALVDRVHATPLHGRVILLADPVEDDDAYLAWDQAREKFITVRSLLNGLDEVVPGPPEDKKEQTEVAKRSRDEEPEDEEFEEDEDSEEEYDEDDVDDADLEDEDEDDLEDEDDDDDEDEEPEPAPRRKRRAPAVEEEDEEDDVEEDDDEDSEYDDDEEEEEEPAPARRPAKKSAPAKKAAAPAPKAKAAVDAPAKKWTQASLAALDRDDLYEVASGFGVGPAKGRKVATIINMVLEVQNGEKPKASAPAPKTPAAAPAKAATPKAPAVSKAPAVEDYEPHAILAQSVGFGMDRVVKITMKHVGQALINASEEL